MLTVIGKKYQEETINSIVPKFILDIPDVKKKEELIERYDHSYMTIQPCEWIHLKMLEARSPIRYFNNNFNLMKAIRSLCLIFGVNYVYTTDKEYTKNALNSIYSLFQHAVWLEIFKQLHIEPHFQFQD